MEGCIRPHGGGAEGRNDVGARCQTSQNNVGRREEAGRSGAMKCWWIAGNGSDRVVGAETVVVIAGSRERRWDSGQGGGLGGGGARRRPAMWRGGWIS